MLFLAVLQSDTVDAVYVSNHGFVQEPNQDDRRTLLLHNGTCHVLYADITGGSHQEVHEALARGLAKRTRRERSQNHVGQGHIWALHPHLHNAVPVHQWFYLPSSANSPRQARSRKCDDQTIGAGPILYLFQSAAESRLRNCVFDAFGKRRPDLYRDNQRLRDHRIVHHARLRATQDVGRLVGELGERGSVVKRSCRCSKIGDDCRASREDT